MHLRIARRRGRWHGFLIHNALPPNVPPSFLPSAEHSDRPIAVCEQFPRLQLVCCTSMGVGQILTGVMVSRTATATV